MFRGGAPVGDVSVISEDIYPAIAAGLYPWTDCTRGSIAAECRRNGCQSSSNERKKGKERAARRSVSYTYIGATDDYSIPLGFIVALRECARSLGSRVVSLRTFLLNAMTDGADSPASAFIPGICTCYCIQFLMRGSARKRKRQAETEGKEEARPPRETATKEWGKFVMHRWGNNILSVIETLSACGS